MTPVTPSSASSASSAVAPSPPSQRQPSGGEHHKKCTFYDMKHSNNSARVRLWLRIKQLQDQVDTVWLGHDDLETAEYANINPLRKVPSLVTDKGLHLFEAFVIMQYLEDRLAGVDTSGVDLVLDDPDDRAFVQLLVRCHDVYISSPNCTQPNFSHTQGCMYLDPAPTQFTPPRRTMDARTRAAKLAEIHGQLTWLEGQARMPYLAGARVTHADLTWFPTAVFMELLLPRCFGWSPIFRETEHFPKLTGWFQLCLKDRQFALTRGEIREALLSQAARGRFEGVRQDVKDHPEYKWKYM